MAIQQINLGSMPLGAGGDTQRAANEKTNQNFSNQAHAASRLVGESSGNVMQVGAFNLGRSAFNGVTASPSMPVQTGFYRVDLYRSGLMLNWDARSGSGRSVGIAFHPSGAASTVFWQATATTPTLYEVYTTQNTTKDTATGFIKASSPVLHVYNDSITKIHEAEQLDITVDKKGTGHYEIRGTTGLRKNDGWFMSPPRDVHGNVLCMVDLDEKDGVVILKTYKKKFDFETVSIVHDYDNPMDIPEGVCVEFRFNDLPQEQLDEPIE